MSLGTCVNSFGQMDSLYDSLSSFVTMTGVVEGSLLTIGSAFPWAEWAPRILNEYAVIANVIATVMEMDEDWEIAEPRKLMRCTGGQRSYGDYLPLFIVHRERIVGINCAGEVCVKTPTLCDEREAALCVLRANCRDIAPLRKSPFGTARQRFDHPGSARGLRLQILRSATRQLCDMASWGVFVDRVDLDDMTEGMSERFVYAPDAISLASWSISAFGCFLVKRVLDLASEIDPDAPADLARYLDIGGLSESAVAQVVFADAVRGYFSDVQEVCDEIPSNND